MILDREILITHIEEIAEQAKHIDEFGANVTLNILIGMMRRNKDEEFAVFCTDFALIVKAQESSL